MLCCVGMTTLETATHCQEMNNYKLHVPFVKDLVVSLVVKCIHAVEEYDTD